MKANKVGGIGLAMAGTLEALVALVLAQDCTHEGDWIITKGDSVQGVLRLTPAYARLYDVSGGQPVVTQYPIPLCEAA